MQKGISTRERDLLDAAFLARPEAAAAWRRWRAGVDWDGYLDHTSFALLPRAYRNLRAMGVEDTIFPRCKGIMHQAWLANRHLINACGPALDALTRAAVAPVLLPPASVLTRDGTAVLDRGQPLCWGIAPDQALAAVRTLLDLDWTLEGVRCPGWCLPGYVAGANHLALRPPEGACWLLTWGLDLWPGDRLLRAAAEPRDIGGHRVLALAPKDALCYALWQPGGLNAFGLVAQLLTIAAVAEVRDWPEQAPGLPDLLPGGWDACMEQSQHLFAQWGAPAGFGRTVSVAPGAAAPRNPLRRLQADWRRCRVALNERAAPPAVLRQVPGYLLGRWRLTRLRELPGRALRWLVQPSGEQAQRTRGMDQ
jgi:hypothetical protein